jgi:hypothetical protein
MPKRKDPRRIDPTNKNIEGYVFPKQVREAIEKIVHSDEPDAAEPEKPAGEK